MSHLIRLRYPSYCARMACGRAIPAGAWAERRPGSGRPQHLPGDSACDAWSHIHPSNDVSDYSQPDLDAAIVAARENRPEDHESVSLGRWSHAAMVQLILFGTGERSYPRDLLCRCLRCTANVHHMGGRLGSLPPGRRFVAAPNIGACRFCGEPIAAGTLYVNYRNAAEPLPSFTRTELANLSREGYLGAWQASSGCAEPRSLVRHSTCGPKRITARNRTRRPDNLRNLAARLATV